MELQTDWAFHSDDPDEERTDTFATAEAAFSLRVVPGLKVHSLLVFESVLDPDPGEDRFLGDMGLFVETLYGEYIDGNFTFRGGKFGQKFGIAWDVAPGIWGPDFADYELEEQIGLAAAFAFGNKRTGEHSITLGTFFTDTTVLSDSAVTSRGRTRKSDGEPGNTEDFSSFSVALDGAGIPQVPGLGYHLAYVYRGADAPGESAEKGVAVGATHKFKTGGVEVLSLVEWARLYNFEAAPDTDVDFLTLAAELVRGPWSLALVWTGRETGVPGMPDAHDQFAEISVGYTFESGIKVSGGWRHVDEDAVATDTIGLLLEYERGF